MKLSQMPRADSRASLELWVRGEKKLRQRLGERNGKGPLGHCVQTTGGHGDLPVKLFEVIVLRRAQPAVFHLADPGMHRVLVDKKLLPLDWALARFGHEDGSVAKDTAAGFPLGGSLPPCGLFELEGGPPRGRWSRS